MRPGCEAHVLAETITDHGGHAQQCASEAEALDCVRSAGQASTLLIDSRQLDADAALGLARQASEHGGHPVILIEPQERGRLGARFKAEGFGFLTRPVREQTLLRVLTKTVGDTVGGPALTQPEKPVSSGQSLHILLAEDDPVNALLAHTMLQRAGHRITLAVNGQQAADAVIANDTDFDLVLMDVHMPVLDGAEAIRLIRSHEDARYGEARLPIIALTADDDEDLRRSMLAMGAHRVIPKPLTAQHLEMLLPVGTKAA